MKHNYMIQQDELLFRPITELDIENMRQWRNKDGIRQSFIYQDHISREQQEQWYKNYIENENDIMFIIEYRAQPIGTVALYNIDFNKREAEFGRLMIGQVETRGLGIGQIATKTMCEFGFNKLNLDRIILEVFEDNSYAMRAYQKAGFNSVGQREIMGRTLAMMHLDKLESIKSDVSKV